MAGRRKKAPDPEDLLGSLEARIMKDVWRHGESTVQDVLDRLNARRSRQLAYNTVMSVMARLADKGLLARHREGRAFVYEPTMDRDEFVRHQATQAARQMVEDFGAAAVAGFAHSVIDEPSLREELERILAEEPDAQ